MFGRLFSLGLLLSSVAMLLFMLGFLCLQLGLALLMDLFYLLASKVMVLALAGLALLGLAALCRAVCGDLHRYFRRESVVLRRLLFLHGSRQVLQQQTIAEAQQIGYWARFRRQRLLAADNRKQVRALAAAINDELQARSTQLSASRYKTLRSALRKYRKQADFAAMLSLRQQLDVVD